MAPNAPVDEMALRQAIAAALPDLPLAGFRVLNNGWDSAAVDIDDTFILKFPKHAEAEARLRMEVGLLDFLGPRLTMPVPRMTLHETPMVFSQHRKLPGTSLETADYEELTDVQRDTLAAMLAQFYAELHAIPLDEARQSGAVPIGAWMGPDEILRKTLPLVPAELGAYVHEIASDFSRMPREPGEEIYGFFDGHGWNMAFDHDAGRLSGVFDFADSGFGERHKDLNYSNWISPDLTYRIITRYQALTGYPVDPRRVMLYSAIQRLWELAVFAEETPEHLPMGLKSVLDWAATNP